MDVQKYIKRLKFARADWSRNIGEFKSKDDAVNFLNGREFFFGDPFVVKYTENGVTRLLFAIGKSENPEIAEDTTEVTGGVGPDAYELFDFDTIWGEIEKLKEAVSANTEAIEELNETVDGLKELVDEISASTGNIEEIVGEGWTDAPDNVTMTDRIKKDEQLAGIVWGHNDGEAYTGHLPNTELPYASGESIAKMIETVSDVLSGVLFEDEGVIKTVKFDYNPSRNILYYTAGTQTGEVKLSQASVVDRAYYDAPVEELVIVFNLGEGEEQEVRIPVGTLVTEWDVENTNTVELVKTRVVDGPDVLKSNVKVSDEAGNMLVAKNSGLFVSNEGVEALENVLDNVKDVLKVAEDGHFIEGSFTGEHTQGLSNYRDAVNALDTALSAAEDKTQEVSDSVAEMGEELSGEISTINDNLPKLKTEVKLGNEVEHLTLTSGFATDGHVVYEIGESNVASKSEVEGLVDELQGAVNDVNDALADEVSARENVELVELPQSALDPDVRAAYVLSNNGNTGSTIIKVYKDSVIYKIYFGHVDDQITSPTDPTVIPGTGNSAICFIYYNENGEYALSCTEFTDVADLVTELGELSDVVNEEQKVVAAALNKLAESIVVVEQEAAAGVDAVREEMQQVSDNVNALSGDVADVKTNVSEIENKLGVCLVDVTNNPDSALSLVKKDDNTVAGDIRISADESNMLKKVDGELFVDDSVVVDTAAKCDVLSNVADNLKQVLNTAEDGHLVARFTGPHTSTSETYYDAVNALDSAIVNAEGSARATDNSFRLDYNKSGQTISLNWEVEGSERHSTIDVSDFVKDSFLEEVQIVTKDGVQCLEFRFKTYDGQPVPIYVPLTELAVIYSAGDGIDAEELENNQVITVKIDEFAQKSWLAKSPNGLLVTGITEAIEEAIATADFTNYVKKSEVENHLDENSTLPAQNRVIKLALDNLSDELNSRIDYVEDLVSGITGGSFNEFVRKSEVEDHLDDNSTLPVQNKVVKSAIDGLQDAIDAEAGVRDEADQQLNQEIDDETSARTAADETLQNNIDAETSARTAADEELANQITSEASARTEADDELREMILGISGDSLFDVQTVGSGNVVTSLEKNGHNVVATLGTIDLSDVMSVDEFKNYTASTATAFTSENITTTGITAQTINATTYNNLPTATTSQYGVVIVDDTLDSASTNPVENRAVYDKFEDFYTKDEVDDLIEDITSGSSRHYFTKNEFRTYTGATSNEFVTNNLIATNVSATTYNNLPTATTTNYGVVKMDDSLSSTSTNPVQNSVLYNVLAGVERDIDQIESTLLTVTTNDLTGVTTSGSGNVIVGIEKDGKNIKATFGTVASDKVDTTTFAAFTAATVNGVTTAGTGNVVVKVEKDGDNVKATYGNVDVANKVDTTAFTAFTAATLNDVTTVGSGAFVTNVEKDGNTIVKVTKSSSLSGVDGLTANTIQATTYKNLPTATTTNYGVVILDDELNTGSTNPVQNSAVSRVIADNELVIAAALNDLNTRKADISSIPTSLTQFDEYTTIAKKSDLAGYLPLSGGTLTGTLNGTIISADTFNAQTGFFQTSDERYKIFIGEVENALEKANSIPTKYFYWKDAYDGPMNLGTSAQKVQEVFPEIVGNDGGKLSVDYAKLSIVALAAIKELTAKVNDLQNQLNELKK